MGIRKCIVPKCPSSTARSEDRGVTFHKIPYLDEMKRVWITACHLPDEYHATKGSNVCSRHFRKSDFQDFKGKKYVLKFGVIPTVFTWTITRMTEDDGKKPAAPAVKKSPSKEVATEGRDEDTEDDEDNEIDKDVQHEVGDKDENIIIKEDAKVTALLKFNREQAEKLKASAPPKRAASIKKGASTTAKRARLEPASSPKKQSPKKAPTIDVKQSPGGISEPIESSPEKGIEFSPGTRIEAQDFSGTWHSAKLLEVDTEDREVLVQFDKTDKIKTTTLEEWIPMDSVRLRPISAANFAVGEKVFARWSDSRKFKATIKNVLENDMYEVVFDDGFAKICKTNHISRIKRSEDVQSKGPAEKQEKELNKVSEQKPIIKTEPVDQPETSEMPATLCSVNQLRVTQLVKLSDLPEIPRDGEWCCHWMNDYPVGEPSEVDLPGGRVYTVIVPDWRMPEGWIKHIFQRITAYGKMDVVLITPTGKVLRSKQEVKGYLADIGETYDVEKYDFGLHRKRAKDLGFCHYTQEYKDSFLPKPVAEPVLLNTEVNIGSVTVKIIGNLYQCPEAECLKTFRKENHLQIHIKHYHKELAKGLGVIPNMQDLAALRTPIDLLESPKPVSRKSNVHAASKTPTVTVKEEKQDEPMIVDKPEPAQEAPVAVADQSLKSVKDNIFKVPVIKQEFDKHAATYGEVKGSPMQGSSTVVEEKKVFEEGPTVEPSAAGTSKLKTPSKSSKIKSVLQKNQSSDVNKAHQGPVASKKTPVVKKAKRTRTRRSAVNQTVPPVRGYDSNLSYSYGSFGGSFNEPSDGFYDDSINASVGSNVAGGLLDENGEVIKIVRMRKEEIINCLCKVTEEDGLMVQCEMCLCWQHAFCQNIRNSSEVPDTYVCNICRYPYRGRASKRYAHDQDWLYEGKLPVAKYHSANSRHAQRFDILKNAHTLTGNLLELKRFMHSLQVKINIAEKKDHPKMYLWSKKWEKSPPRGDGAEKQQGETADRQPMPQVPVPEAPIDPAECQAILLDHIQKQQNDAMGRLQAIEAQIIGLEAYDEKADLLESPTAKNYPKAKQTIHMLLNDLLKMTKIANIHSDFNTLAQESRLAQQ